MATDQHGYHDGQGPDPLRAAAVIGVALIQAGLAGLFVTTWWRHAQNIVASPEVGSALWRVLSAVLFVWVVVAEVRGLVRGRRSPLLVVSLAAAATVVVVLLEVLAPR
ncbi:hypothetical protein [Krasilnikoviella flava]|uniref:Uncharacterized protein n=1 Tax=Krasilnikoviella flava TaxID=526729 RepID=A0A1T5IQK0_9MICO|nr:hypothetical protein [Krasilnikoviella flava]SKC41421.1 hypothetical protein SAMN04324258_0812 [Krasilnikoviella flava]